MDLPNAPSDTPSQETASDEGATLFLCCSSPKLGAQIETVLTAQSSRVTSISLADIPAALEADPEAQAILLYDSAVLTLITRTQKNESPEAILADWSDEAREMLDTQTKNRRRITMMEAYSVLVYADIFVARLGLPETCTKALSDLPRINIDPVLLSLAQASLQEDRAARQLVATLRAATVELSNSPPGQIDELESAFVHYTQTKSHLSDLRVELEHRILKETEASNALRAAQTQAADLTQELESARQREAGFSARLAEAERNHSALQDAARVQTTDLEHLTKLNDKLSKKTEELKATLSAQADQHDRAVKELDEMSRRLQTMEADAKTQRAEVEKLRTVNAEINADRSIVSSKLKHAETDLERQYHRRHKAETDLEEISQKTRALEAETTAKRIEIETLSKDKRDIETRLADTEHWLQGILASRSYRIMAPVRRLRAAFKRKE